jgi:uncharacterized protein YraI
MKSKKAALWKISGVVLILALTLPISIAWAREDRAAQDSSEQTIQEAPLLQTTVTATTTRAINMRARPSTSGKVIGSVARNKTVPVLGRDSASRWILVAQGNKRGWIAGWLTVIRGDLRNVPVTDQVVGSTGSTPVPTPTPIPCPDTWFIARYSWFAAQPVADVCPSPAIAIKAAYQPFQHGAMIWEAGVGGYRVLPFDPSTGQQLGDVIGYQDPLTVYRDTSASYTPPSGLFAPVSGFGIVWRGDNWESGDHSLLKLLGWGLTPEVSYTITRQSGVSTFTAGGTTYAVMYTYLTLPDGRVISLGQPVKSMGIPNPTTLSILPAQ